MPPPLTRPFLSFHISSPHCHPTLTKSTVIQGWDKSIAKEPSQEHYMSQRTTSQWIRATWKLSVRAICSRDCFHRRVCFPRRRRWLWYPHKPTRWRLTRACTMLSPSNIWLTTRAQDRWSVKSFPLPRAEPTCSTLLRRSHWARKLKISGWYSKSLRTKLFICATSKHSRRNTLSRHNQATSSSSTRGISSPQLKNRYSRQKRLREAIWTRGATTITLLQAVKVMKMREWTPNLPRLLSEQSWVKLRSHLTPTPTPLTCRMTMKSENSWLWRRVTSSPKTCKLTSTETHSSIR